ncbi:alpha/beta-hydrolase [Roridomyces roridus]|uniref:Alpha/beta-hydrolase n=1 Tax=Roridomyces roridus TaxID=1738132 RepID=A0AAD7FGA2_9AGAR|nr:alpha/beta-hydrolase [Roridomyces roridus]
MSPTSKSDRLVLPSASPQRPRRSFSGSMAVVFLSVITIWTLCRSWYSLVPTSRVSTPSESFYHRIHKPAGICGNSSAVSYSGHIGLHGDSEISPKRSFFWYFEADGKPADAPIILTIGGGPGTSGMMNPLQGQSPCSATEDGLVLNPYTWTRKHNLLALDHPIGVGFSYGTHVNNSRTAAHDVYDFLQKFFILFPHLARNKFIVSGGSYSVEHHLHNETECAQLYSMLPACLDSIDMALQVPTVANRVAAVHLCYGMNEAADFHGTVIEDIRRTCIPKPGSDPVIQCHPQFKWFQEIFSDTHVRRELGVPAGLNFTSSNRQVNEEFHAEGDSIRAHELLYPPLLAAGIRVLHYIGKQDANCPWLGTLSFLKLLNTPIQQSFLNAPDVPWPANIHEDVGTARAVGPGAGNLTLVLLEGAGHFTVADQPALAQKIVETWVANEPWF